MADGTSLGIQGAGYDRKRIDGKPEFGYQHMPSGSGIHAAGKEQHNGRTWLRQAEYMSAFRTDKRLER